MRLSALEKVMVGIGGMLAGHVANTIAGIPDGVLHYGVEIFLSVIFIVIATVLRRKAAI
jgi:hypothetical protein